MRNEPKLESSSVYKQIFAFQKKNICNGCGAKGIGGYLVPDTMWGLPVTEACNIHDYDYHLGRCKENKDKADLRFLRNLDTLIEFHTDNTILKYLRFSRARVYYNVVKYFGKSAFLEGKHFSY